MPDKEVGAARPRREDPELLTGAARYTEDHEPADGLHAAFVRCPYGHARVERVDVGPALEVAGVVDALGAAELADRGGPPAIRTQNYFPGPDEIDRPLLVSDRARFAGDPVAIVLAEDRYAARDGAEAVEVAYDRLPAVTDPREAASGEPTIGGEASDVVEWTAGDAAAVDRAFDRAARTVSVDVEMPRLISAPMEPRSVLAQPDDCTDGSGTGGNSGDPGRLTVTTSTQTPHRDRDRIARTLDRPTDRVRVVAPAVGGGFGPKGARPYPEEPLVAWLAVQHDRPVGWTATRSEAQRTDHQGRGIAVRGELALDPDGRARALRVEGHVGVGGYPLRGPSSAVKPHLLPGPYDVPAVHCRLVGTLTNNAPLGPYRGAGRPEAIYVVERLLERAADELGLEPDEVRRRNFVPPEAFPHETALGYTFDSGAYAAALDLALDAADYDAVRREQAAAREEGRYLGVGLASFVENTGSSWNESARVEVDASGRVRAACGTADGGQGHATTFAQLLADELGIPFDDVEFVEGDTDAVPDGTGTFGCRSVPVGASGLVECARDVVEAARSLAADRLEAAPVDLQFEDGAFHVSGAADRAVSLATLAGDAGRPLAAERDYEPPGYAYAFGTHVAVVEVDPATGGVELRRYVAVDDCGVQLNPTLVDGQVHGGVAQGLGQALSEAAVYDDAGTLVTGSLQDYALPRAADLPDLETESTVTPSPETPHGAKGIGEAGTIAAPPAVVNAVLDALEPLGVDDLTMPLTQETVWRAVEAAG